MPANSRWDLIRRLRVKWRLYNRVDVYGIDFIPGERLEGK